MHRMTFLARAGVAGAVCPCTPTAKTAAARAATAPVIKLVRIVPPELDGVEVVQRPGDDSATSR
jgi:hypothetical protein